MKGLVDNRGAAHHAATTPDSSHYTKGAQGTYTSRRGAAFQPRCREGRWNDCRRCAGVPRVRAVSPPRIELSSTLAARALRPPARPPTPSARRGGRAVPPRVRPSPCVRPGAGVSSPRCRDSHASSCARGVLAWRRRSGLSGKGRSCADGAVPWGPPREPMPASVPCGARVAAASAGQDGAGDHGTREHMSKTLQSGHAVDLKKSTQVLGSVR